MNDTHITLHGWVGGEVRHRDVKGVSVSTLRVGVTPSHDALAPIEAESPLLVWLSRKLDGAAYRRIRRQAAGHIARLVAREK